jgi:hypothetical protein
MEKPLTGAAARFTGFWWSDGGFFPLLVFLLVSSFLVPTIDSLAGRLIIGIFFTLLLVSGVANISTNPYVRIGAGLLAGVAILLHWLADIMPSRELACWQTASSLIYFALLTWVVLRRAFSGGTVTFGRIKEAVAAYILLAITWSYFYQITELLIPGAFALTNPAVSLEGDYLRPTLTYFSFITLTTLGYGDIVPVNHPARLFVIVEALMGQLYPATLLARLVSLEIVHRGEKQQTDAMP